MSKPSNKKIDRLDLACGNNKQKGFCGVDITRKGTQADIEHNLSEYPWPFKDDSIKETFCSHYLEHIPHIDSYHDGLFLFMDEIWRILKVGGIARFVVPYYSSVRAIQDPTHHRSIGEPTFLYFTKNWRKINRLEHYPVKCNFEIVKIDHAVSEEFIGRASDAVQFQAMHSWNVINDMLVTLKKIK